MPAQPAERTLTGAMEFWALMVKAPQTSFSLSQQI